MQSPVTKEYLDGLKRRLEAAERLGNKIAAARARDDYRAACAAAYSSGDLVFAGGNDGAAPVVSLTKPNGFRGPCDPIGR